MPRYIDAEKIPYTDLNADMHSKVRVYVAFKERIDRVPTADVVEVVRCKDCKHAIEDKLFGGLGCKHPTEKHCERNAGFYCGSGERREDGSN